MEQHTAPINSDSKNGEIWTWRTSKRAPSLGTYHHACCHQYKTWAYSSLAFDHACSHSTPRRQGEISTIRSPIASNVKISQKKKFQSKPPINAGKRDAALLRGMILLTQNATVERLRTMEMIKKKNEDLNIFQYSEEIENPFFLFLLFHFSYGMERKTKKRGGGQATEKRESGPVIGPHKKRAQNQQTNKP